MLLLCAFLFYLDQFYLVVYFSFPGTRLGCKLFGVIRIELERLFDLCVNVYFKVI
jgi:hypothetical protein